MKPTHFSTLATVTLCALGLLAGLLAAYWLATQFQDTRMPEPENTTIPYRFPEDKTAKPFQNP